MSQYRGYYTSKDNPPAISSSLPFIVNTSEDDFEYDRGSISNKRSFSQVESSTQYSSHDSNKCQKVNHYYSSNSSNAGGSSSTSSSTATTTSSGPPVLSPELSMPVFQTADRCNEWEAVKPVVKTGDDAVTVMSENAEKWAWGTGNKWVGATGPRPKLNVYSGAPKIEMFTSAAKVSGGIGEKMLQKMGWRQGEGLGKCNEGATEPIAFNEIKTDRKGLVSHDADSHIVEAENVQEKTKSKFSELKSTSFWNWHGSGMKGPENVNARLRNEKKAAKDKIPPTLDLSGKHPVSALMELCSKKKWKEPKFSTETCGAGFIFKV